MAAGQRWRAWRSCFRALSWRGLFCDAVLKMSIDSTEGETLPLCTAAVLEGVVCKLFIVAVVVEDTDAVLLDIVLKGLFCFNHLF